jgi:hypothetical protein
MGDQMDEEDVKARLARGLAEVVKNDRYLFETDNGERAIAARLAACLQREFADFNVDAEYNRAGKQPKRLRLPEECAKYRNENEESLAVPDVIVHRRGAEGPNLLVLELKKTTNPDKGACDRVRLHAFREQLGYTYGALIICETRKGREPAMTVAEWVG